MNNLDHCDSEQKSFNASLESFQLRNVDVLDQTHIQFDTHSTDNRHQLSKNTFQMFYLSSHVPQNTLQTAPALRWRAEDCHSMAASQPSSTGWHRGGLATSEPTLLSSFPPLCLLMLHFTGFSHQQPTSRHHSANSSGTESASSLVPLAG